MTTPNTSPHNWPRTRAANTPALAPNAAAVSSLAFVIGPDSAPADAIRQATAVVDMAVPTFFAKADNAARICADVKAVLTELVDITARNQAGIDLVGQVAYDGSHVMISVGDMARPLPEPEEEPGLYLVHGVADEVGQYAGDMGGRVTWAAVAT